MKRLSEIVLRRLIYSNYVKLKELSLSKRQVELITYLKDGKATSRDIADKYEICVQNASQQLNNLFRKGYLTRIEVEDKTGGYIFEYRANQEVFK
jgi:predicted transcriptional regulator